MAADAVKKLSPEQSRMLFWEENGFLILENFFSEAEIDGVNACVEQLWKQRPNNIIADKVIEAGSKTRIRKFMSDLTESEVANNRFVINDLYLEREAVRSLCLKPELTSILSQLLGTTAVLAQSLNFKYGSQQGMHSDCLYLTPKTPHHLIAIWIALEDISPDSGPLRYIPGSHKIPLFYFSNGSRHFVPEEISDWDAHIEKYVNKWQLKEEIVTPKKGDVFIWHADLLHGGTEINNPEHTRKSLVAHYRSKQDILSDKINWLRLRRKPSYWLKRNVAI